MDTLNYFVVFLVEPKVYVTIPQNWVKGIDDYFEKFLADGLNTDQPFLIFWSQYNRRPRFNIGKAMFPAEGNYVARLSKYFGKFCLKPRLFKNSVSSIIYFIKRGITNLTFFHI